MGKKDGRFGKADRRGKEKDGENGWRGRTRDYSLLVIRDAWGKKKDYEGGGGIG